MSVEKLIVTKEASPFTMLPNKVLQNFKDLNALGMWSYLASLPPSWEFYKEHLRKHFGIGKNKLEKIFSTLREHNLVMFNPVRNSKGQFTHWNIHILSGEGFFDPNEKNAQNAQITQNAQNSKKETKVESISCDNAHPQPGKPGVWETMRMETGAYKETNNKTNKKNKLNIFSASPDAYESFEKFWNVHPRKKDKKRALDLWIKLNCHEIHEKIINTLADQIQKDAQWQNIQFVPYPTTYLRNQRWEDEITPISSGPRGQMNAFSSWINNSKEGAMYDENGNPIESFH